MIAIVDYGMGNLRSVSNAFESVGHRAVVTRDPATIRSAGHVVLPGVGAFGDCMANIERFNLVEPVRSSIQSGKPFLGICLGMQLLFTESQEFGVHQGFNIIPGIVRKFALDPALKVPHMGRNQVHVRRNCPIFGDIPDGSNWYFVHSYFVDPVDPLVAAAVTTYGVPFVSTIWKDNIVACQFHPEKSQSVGLRLIKNFGAWRA
jgi:glutamine amidotransferase